MSELKNINNSQNEKNKYKLTIGKIFKHFHLINKHRLYVFLYCCKFHIPWRGIKHDLSKYSPTEFFESAKYYTGSKSPIDTCKELFGFSKAWMHHKGRNTHHYEHWQDNFDNGTKRCKMPFKDSLEMLCDYLGAARSYMGKDFTYIKEYEWYLEKIKVAKAMHPVNREFLKIILKFLSVDIKINYKIIKTVYDILSEIYDRYENVYKNEKDPKNWTGDLIWKNNIAIQVKYNPDFHVVMIKYKYQDCIEWEQ